MEITLTPRQLEILYLISEGVTATGIAAKLYVEVSTVKTHLRRLFREMGAKNRAHAVAIAFRGGLFGELPPPAQIAEEGDEVDPLLAAIGALPHTEQDTWAWLRTHQLGAQVAPGTVLAAVRADLEQAAGLSR